MTNPTAWLRIVDDGAIVSVRVTPGARRTEVLDRSGDVLRIKVAAPPVEGRANTEVVRVVAELLGVRPSRVSVISGDHARDKALHASGDGAGMAARAAG